MFDYARVLRRGSLIGHLGVRLACSISWLGSGLRAPEHVRGPLVHASSSSTRRRAHSARSIAWGDPEVGPQPVSGCQAASASQSGVTLDWIEAVVRAESAGLQRRPLHCSLTPNRPVPGQSRCQDLMRDWCGRRSCFA
eukprot:13662446-Alexandrium_andersonii.AAC.1